jgi:NAD(P)-dependent dehydrogenase (short-subunit alcohol dehydrogenase family)
MVQKLNGKSAVVTGGGSGIGREVTLALAAEGAKIVVADFNKERADKVVAEIKQAGGKAVANYDNITTMAGGQNVINTAISSFGSIDILVNCAGFAKNVAAVDITEKDWDDIITVHLKGHFACAQPAAREMIKQKNGGRIINFSSRSGFQFNWSGFGTLPYSTAKAGIVGFTALLSAELKPHNITVNAIFPSAVTPGFPEKRPKFGGGDTATPDFVPPIIVYLCTPEAQKITGQFFYACGGDIMILQRPLQFNGPNKLLRKNGKWTIDELNQIIPPLIDN